MNCTLSRYYHVRHKGTAHVTLDTLQVIAGSKTLNELCRMAPNFLTQSCSALWVRAFHTFRSGVSCSLFNEHGQPVKPVRTHLAVIMFRLAGRTQLSVPVKVGPFTSTLFFWKCPPWTFLFVQAASVLLQWQAFIAHKSIPAVLWLHNHVAGIPAAISCVCFYMLRPCNAECEVFIQFHM